MEYARNSVENAKDMLMCVHEQVVKADCECPLYMYTNYKMIRGWRYSFFRWIPVFENRIRLYRSLA